MHPACAGCSHTLGTVEGNLHFLLGYVNPRFHVAPYHWFFVDPFLTSDHTEELEHPSNASCCASFGELSDEGDIEKGFPHTSVTAYFQRVAEVVQDINKSMYVSENDTVYKVSPEKNLVVDTKNKKAYRWELISDTYFASRNTKISAAMAKVGSPLAVQKAYTFPVPSALQSQLVPSEAFHADVYEAVKVHLPPPSSVIPMITDTTEEIYAVVKSDRVDFFDRGGAPASLQFYDRLYTSFDLIKGGNVHPSLLVNFLSLYTEFNKSVYQAYVNDGLTPVAAGEATPGFSDVSDDTSDISSSRKHVVHSEDGVIQVQIH
tara:strand:- start:11106 stop:12059 length:954 start_codon:yes stop_codon:yes gene_type:complete